MMSKILHVLGNTESLPNTLTNPFDSTKVERIYISCSKSLFSDEFRTSGSVEFRNDRTKGEQEFKGDDIMDVVQQIYKFLEQL